MATPYCPFCGASLAGINAAYCPHCGQRLPEVDTTPTSQAAQSPAPPTGQPTASAQPQPVAHSPTPSRGYQTPPPVRYAPPPSAAPSYGAPQPYMAPDPAAGGGAGAQLYVMAPQSPVTPGRAVGTTAALCALALVLTVVLDVVVDFMPLAFPLDGFGGFLLLGVSAWTLVAAFWLATRALARQSFSIVLLENAALCLILLLLLPVLALSVLPAPLGTESRIQPLIWLLPYPMGKDVAILLFAALAALIATGIAAGFASWSRVRAATHMPLTAWSFVQPGLVVSGVFLIAHLVANWLLYHGPIILFSSRHYILFVVLFDVLFDVVPVVGLGILAGALNYTVLRRSMSVLSPQAPPRTSTGAGSTP